ncbi:putative reverse transcriptase domain-containing protein [Tanacetum coccineum]
MINEGVTAVLAARNVTRNGDDSHTSGTGARRPVQVARECTYPDFLKCQPLNFKGTKGVVGLTYQRFQELALICDRMFPEEIDQVEKYVGGLPDTIHGSVMATKPKTMQDAIEFATELMDKKINTLAERNGDRRPYGGPKPIVPNGNPPNINTGSNQRHVFDLELKGISRRIAQKYEEQQQPGIIRSMEMPDSMQRCMPWALQGKLGQQIVVTGVNDVINVNGTVSHRTPAEHVLAPILALPEGSEDFIAYCDASKKGLGAVLMQREKNWRHYLYGTKCMVFTDHKSLQHILDQKELNMRQRRWKEREPLRVRALVMTIGLDLPKQILKAQTEA